MFTIECFSEKSDTVGSLYIVQDGIRYTFAEYSLRAGLRTAIPVDSIHYRIKIDGIDSPIINHMHTNEINYHTRIRDRRVEKMVRHGINYAGLFLENDDGVSYIDKVEIAMTGSKTKIDGVYKLVTKPTHNRSYGSYVTGRSIVTSGEEGQLNRVVGCEYFLYDTWLNIHEYVYHLYYNIEQCGITDFEKSYIDEEIIARCKFTKEPRTINIKDISRFVLSIDTSKSKLYCYAYDYGFRDNVVVLRIKSHIIREYETHENFISIELNGAETAKIIIGEHGIEYIIMSTEEYLLMCLDAKFVDRMQLMINYTTHLEKVDRLSCLIVKNFI